MRGGDLSRTTPFSTCSPPPSNAPRIRDRLPGHLAAGIAVAVVLVQVVIVLGLTGGHFTYSLDDPYIHLALANQIRHGTYGINPGEPSSPSSSMIWPFLLALLGGREWLPIVLNLAATAGTAAVLASVVPLRSATARVAVTSVVVFSLNFASVALTGMEHSLQCLASVCVGAGVVRVVRNEVAPWWMWVGMVIGPWIRYENVAVTGAAVLCLIRCVPARHILAAGSFAVLPLAAFSLFLASLGLDPLPSSVLAKSAYSNHVVGGAMNALSANLEKALAHPTFVWLIITVLAHVVRYRYVGRLHTFVVLVLTSHAAFGDFGWLGRYELYAYAATIPAAAALATQLLVGCRRWVPAVAAFVCLATSLPTLEPAIIAPAVAREIYLQQGQMADLAAQVNRPVALNDIGLVASHTRVHVLDLWGLANQDARKARLSGESDWVQPLIEDSDVQVAMIYPEWFTHQIPAQWTHLADLQFRGQHFVVRRTVAIYSTRPAEATAICRDLKVAARSIARPAHLIDTAC